MTNIKINSKNFTKTLFLLFIWEFTNYNININHKAIKYIIGIIIVQLENIIEGTQNNIVNIFETDEVLQDRTIKGYPKNIKLPPIRYMDSFMNDIKNSRFHILYKFLIIHLAQIFGDKMLIGEYLKSFKNLKQLIISYLTIITEIKSNVELKYFINTVTIKLFTDTTYTTSQIKKLIAIFEKLKTDILQKTQDTLTDNNTNINTYVQELLENPENNSVNMMVILQLIEKFAYPIIQANKENNQEKITILITDTKKYSEYFKRILELLLD